MTNPFEQLFKDYEQPSEPYETVSGAMSCNYCSEVAVEGRYYYMERLLEYRCPAGHHNKLEGVSL